MTYSQINPTKVGGFLLLTTLILVAGCSNVPSPCILGWSNETHFCNEFHYYEEKWVANPNDCNRTKEGVIIAPVCACT